MSTSPSQADETPGVPLDGMSGKRGTLVCVKEWIYSEQRCIQRFIGVLTLDVYPWGDAELTREVMVLSSATAVMTCSGERVTGRGREESHT